MKSDLYDNNTPLEMAQLLDVFMDRPLETLMMMCKKILISFDKQTNVSYPIPGNPVPWRQTNGIMFSLWNYALLFGGLWALFNSDSVAKDEKHFAWLIFVTMVFPETFMKIEWRYVFAGYIWLYYLMSYHFAGRIISSRDYRITVFQNSKFMILLALFSFLYLTCSFVFLA